MIKSAKPLTVESQADLHDIIRHGDINQLRVALKKKHNPLDKDVDGYTALHIAALYGKLELMKHLIEEEQLYPTVPGPKKATPLIVAAGSGNLSIVKYLIEEQHIDPSADRDEDGYLAIHRACQKSKLSVVKYLFEKTKEVCMMNTTDIFSDCTEEDTALLHIAALSGNIDTVKYFTEECKCDTNLLNEAGRTALFHACQSGNLEVVTYFVEMGHCQCSITDSSLNTPLHLAAQHGSLSVVQYLLKERTCNANLKNGKRNTPLLEASYAGQLNTVKYLLENGYNCNPKASGSNGYNCLHAACSFGHVDMVQYLIEECKMDPSASTRKEKRTNSLHIASRCGHDLVVNYLIYKRKMDPNCSDQNRNTPLSLAIIHEQFQVVDCLVNSQKCDAIIMLISQSMLDQVKDSRIRDCINERKKLIPISLSNPQLHPLVTTCVYGDLNTLKRRTKKALQSCKHVFGQRLIHVAAECGHLKIIIFFIQNDIFKADLQDENLFTPLHLAAGKGYVDIFKYLVQECKCDPKCKTSTDFDKYSGGATPLDIAVQHGQLSMVKHILESDYGIDADAENHNGTTPFQRAAMKGHLDIMKYLTKKHNCDASHRDKEMTTAMHLAARNNHLDVMRYLREEMKCDPTEYTRTLTGRSTIHIAANNGYLNIIKYLISKCGIDPNMPSTRAGDFETALHCSAYWGHLHIVKYLTQLPNCDISCRSVAKSTPLHMAAEQGHCKVVKYLAQLYEEKQLKSDKYGNVTFNYFGDVPLHSAAQNGRFEVVVFLCREMGTSPVIRNHYNQTPLHLAFQNNHHEVALYLIVVLYFECQDCSV